MFTLIAGSNPVSPTMITKPIPREYRVAVKTPYEGWQPYREAIHPHSPMAKAIELMENQHMTSLTFRMSTAEVSIERVEPYPVY